MLIRSPFPALGLLGLVGLASGCVVTTFEGPGEPPRITAPPPEPGKKPASEGFGDTFAEAPAKTEDRIAARHLLVMYKGSMRAPLSVTRTKEEALARANEAAARAKAGEDFPTLVREFSDEPGAGERGGDLGRFDRSMMVKEFSNAAFALDVGAISGVVETPFGYHVIQRTE
jgi:hypothetical protein